MEKWADKLVSAVRFNSTNTHIDKLKVHLDQGDKISPGVEMNRADVIAEIKRGITYCTIYIGKDGKWIKGASIVVIKVGASEYLKTKADNTPKDNLDNLPTF